MEPCLHRNKPATKIDMAVFKKHVEDFPDSYRHECAKHFGVSPSCLLYALRRLKIRKKTFFHPQADAEKRADFASKLYRYGQAEHRPVISDESHFSVEAVRDRGYGSIGARCYGSKDWHSRGRLNAIGAIHNFNILNICLFEGNINADVFYARTVHQLLPSFPERAVIVADNGAYHKFAFIQFAHVIIFDD